MVDSYDDIFVRAFSLLEQTGILAKSYGEWEIGDWGELREDGRLRIKKDFLERSNAAHPISFSLFTQRGAVEVGGEILITANTHSRWVHTDEGFRPLTPSDARAHFILCETSRVVNCASILASKNVSEAIFQEFWEESDQPFVLLDLPEHAPVSLYEKVLGKLGACSCLVDIPSFSDLFFTPRELALLHICAARKQPPVLQFVWKDDGSCGLEQTAAKYLAARMLVESICPGLPVLLGVELFFDDPQSAEILHCFSKLAHRLGALFSVGGILSRSEMDVAAGVCAQWLAQEILTLKPALVQYACGNLNGLEVFSAEKFLLDEEIFLRSMRLAKGIKVDRGSLLFDEIKRVGPRGMFLSTKMIRVWKEESYQNTCFHTGSVQTSEDYTGVVEKTAGREAKRRIELYEKMHRKV